MHSSLRETFEQFMARALHDPEKGYYRSGIADVGRQGDFSTSATLFPELAKALAHWLRRRRESDGLKTPVAVIEAGGGTGRLMEGILKELGWWQRRNFRFHSVETSENLEKKQRKLLESKGVLWHRDMKSALEAVGGQALIYSNELVDAFPCSVWGFEAGCWKELVLQWTEGKALETWPGDGDARSGRMAEEIAAFCTQPVKGQRIEIPWSYREWLETWLPAWKKGRLLTIDYGACSEDLCRLNRFGSLRAYFRHMHLEGEEIYRRAGRQDITFDVNFSLLKKWGEEQGLENISCRSQREFCGDQALRPGADFQAEEAQERFLVLEQRRR